jgi:hypothetical protein
MLKAINVTRKMFILMLILAASLLLATLSVNTSFALDPWGAVDATPLQNGVWHELAPGEVHWYKFGYNVGYKQTNDDDDDDDFDKEFEIVAPYVSIRLISEPNNLEQPGFSVWTPERLKQLQIEGGDDNEAQPLGRGSPEEHAKGDLFWRGRFDGRGTYYVAVENKSNETRYYALYMNTDSLD